MKRRGFTIMGARYYDPRTSVWVSPDPILNQIYNDKNERVRFNKVFGMYTYTNNNPINIIDPDGKDVISSNTFQNNNKHFESEINKFTIDKFKFDKNNKLQMVQKNANPKGSAYYNTRLHQAIKSPKPTFLDKSNFIDEVPIGVDKTSGKLDMLGIGYSDVDYDHGGGLTWNNEPGFASIIVSGNSSEQTNADGSKRKVSSGEILMHELLGHAIPHTVKSDTGNAVDNTNKAFDQLHLKQRKSEPGHVE